jgi:hypothetical protein
LTPAQFKRTNNEHCYAPMLAMPEG